MIDFHSLKYSTYARIVTERKTYKVGKKSFETVNLDLLGRGSFRAKMDAWRRIMEETAKFMEAEDDTTELIERWERMNNKRTAILICMRVLQDKESQSSIDALVRLGVTGCVDRKSSLQNAQNIFSGITLNMESLERELEDRKGKTPKYQDYLKEFIAVNEQLGGSLNFNDVLLCVYLTARSEVKARNPRRND